MNLYETLGLSVDAGDSDIKTAYRRLAKQLHPDVTPDQRDEFEAVKLAYEILSDPMRRADYDETGIVEDQAAENLDIAPVLLRALKMALEHVLVSIEPEKVGVVDVVARIHQQLAKQLDTRGREIEKARRQQPLWEAMRDRFEVEEGPNLLRGMVAEKIADIEHGIGTFEACNDIDRRVVELIQHQRYRLDPLLAQALRPVDIYTGRTSLSNTLFGPGIFG